MDTKKSFPDKKRKIIRYLGIALIIIGLAIIIYPFYINLILARREADILTSWNVELTSLQDTNGNKEIESTNNKEDLILEKDTKLVDPEKKLPFKISIPEIDLEWIVNEGTDYRTLREGPGFYIDSTLPGEAGTCVVAGHRSTYGAPFSRLDELEEGDEIFLETDGNEEFTYIVTGKKAVIPTDMSVLENTDYPTLLLSTCTPKYFATRRLVIFARIIE
ncbi:class E sortase [Candidatus Atribacteria bacterium 1244-E10-H5-B2]|nr:MAG: class E sortase [Candidatus Atribacteria bacterium 1244-E10-H5-B2]